MDIIRRKPGDREIAEKVKELELAEVKFQCLRELGGHEHLPEVKAQKGYIERLRQEIQAMRERKAG